MHLARHAITSTPPVTILDARFDADAEIFTVCTPSGFAVYRTCPLQLLRKRELRGGTLVAAVPCHTSSLLFLLGGGRSPLYAPNKVVLWDDIQGREVGELEFRERVRGIACRRGWLVVALRWRVIVFEVGQSINRYQEWDTADNVRGLVALASQTHSTLLAIAGKQMGHVQLIQLPPCPAPTLRSPPSPTIPRQPPLKPSRHPVSMIAAHTSALTAICVLPSGQLLATASARGTLVRVWDAHTGKLIRELRRGSDKADIYGIAFRPDERELCVWSDKGTVHVFSLASVADGGMSNRQSALSPLTPFMALPKYFDSQWSYAQYRIPSQTAHISLSAASQHRISELTADERCMVAWIRAPANPIAAGNPNTSARDAETEYQLVVLTYSGCWYRLALPQFAQAAAKAQLRAETPPLAALRSPLNSPRPRSSSGSSVTGRVKVDKGKAKEAEDKPGRDCSLVEFRRFGRWDGWN